MKTSIFAYNGFIGIASSEANEVFPPNPEDYNFAVALDDVEISQDAIDLFKKIEISEDKDDKRVGLSVKEENDTPTFAWNGGPNTYINPADSRAEFGSNFDLFTPAEDVKVDPEFIEFIDDMVASGKAN